MVGGDIYWSSVGSQLRLCPRIPFTHGLFLLFSWGLRKNVEKRALLENMEGLFLAVDEIVDGGWVFWLAWTSLDLGDMWGEGAGNCPYPKASGLSDQSISTVSRSFRRQRKVVSSLSFRVILESDPQQVVHRVALRVSMSMFLYIPPSTHSPGPDLPNVF